mgnify:CR=1 FL=1
MSCKLIKQKINKFLIKNGVSKSVFFLALATFPLVFMALSLEYFLQFKVIENHRIQ